MTGLVCLVMLGFVVYLLTQPEVPQPHKVSFDWELVRGQAMTIALERREERTRERAVRMARYVARFPEDARTRARPVAVPEAPSRAERTIRPIR